MWTATIKEKGITSQGTYVEVDFTDGTEVVTERCIPQDMNGFKLWVEGRLKTFNFKEELDEKFSVGDTAIKEEVTPTIPQNELDWREWYRNFIRLEQVQKLIDMGIFTGTETPIVNLRNKLKNNFKVEYIDRF